LEGNSAGDAATIRFRVKDDGNDATALLSIDPATDFTQVVGVYDKNFDASNNDQLLLYINGELADIAPDTPNSGINDWAGGNKSAIGGKQGSVGGDTGDLGSFGGFIGQIAVVRYYENQILTATQVAENFAFMVPEPSTLLIWSLLAALGIFGGKRRR
jgi:hypothetical protein